MRLIDADELKLELKWLEDDTPVYHDVMSTIDDTPTVDAEPVKRGHWIESKGGDYIGYPIYECSKCGCPVGESASNYCPYCGAKMDEVEDDG